MQAKTYSLARQHALKKLQPNGIPIMYVLLDGVGDLPDPILNNLTPLDAALTPHLDQLSRMGSMGLAYPAGEGIAPESDVGVFGMLGYDLSEEYVGRGAMEAIGAKIDFQNGDLALRANFATLQDDGILGDRRAGRDLSKQDTEELADAITHDVQLSHGAELVFRSTVAHRAIIRIRTPGENLLANISNTDPAYTRVRGMGVAKEGLKELRLQRSEALDSIPGTKLAADLLNEFTENAQRILAEHPVNIRRKSSGQLPANVILARDASCSVPKLDQMQEKYGLNTACLLDMPVEKGIATVTGMVQVEGGDVDDYSFKAQKAKELLPRFDCVYVHIKGPDEPGHDGDSVLKKDVIQSIDKEFFNMVAEQVLDGRAIVIVSADHSTPCQLKAHSSDPVPVMVSGPGIEQDQSCRFTERDGLQGSLGKMEGKQILGEILSKLRK